MVIDLSINSFIKINMFTPWTCFLTNKIEIMIPLTEFTRLRFRSYEMKCVKVLCKAMDQHNLFEPGSRWISFLLCPPLAWRAALDIAVQLALEPFSLTFSHYNPCSFHGIPLIAHSLRAFAHTVVPPPTPPLVPLPSSLLFILPISELKYHFLRKLSLTSTSRS